jgi:ABC-2 type transport system permease protein
MGITLSPWQLLLILALSPLMCLAAGAFAMLIIGLIKSNKTANMVVMVLAMTQMFLSGAYHSNRQFTRHFADIESPYADDLLP